jgi:glycosyltransferase involved in cell wall biosynthesis
VQLYEESLRENGVAERHGFKILMLASLKDYKGVPEFIRLAKRLEHFPEVEMELVANAPESEVREYFAGVPFPANLHVFPSTAQPWTYYSKADLLMNMSRVDQWVETFGMTIVEAMCFGVPCIAPPVGGPREIVREGVDGYLIDSRNEDEVYAAVERLICDKDLLKSMKAAAKERSEDYFPERFQNRIRELLE